MNTTNHSIVSLHYCTCLCHNSPSLGCSNTGTIWIHMVPYYTVRYTPPAALLEIQRHKNHKNVKPESSKTLESILSLCGSLWYKSWSAQVWMIWKVEYQTTCFGSGHYCTRTVSCLGSREHFAFWHLCYYYIIATTRTAIMWMFQSQRICDKYCL